MFTLARSRTRPGWPGSWSALESRVVVEQAKGILAERLGIDPEVAFTRLRRHGRQHGLHLAELARQVVDGSFTLDM